jgi:hypothetical protein
MTVHVLGPYRQQSTLTDNSQAEIVLVSIPVQSFPTEGGTLSRGAFLLEGRVTAWNADNYGLAIYLAGMMRTGLANIQTVVSQPAPYIFSENSSNLTARFVANGDTSLDLLVRAQNWLGNVYWYGQVTMTGRNTF